MEDPDMIMYDLLWAFFDEEPEETDDEFYTVRFSDQSIDRLYQLGCQDGDIFSSKFRMWQEKIKDIFLFYVVGASHSVFDVAYHFTGDGVKIDITLSPDCYEPILFLNSITDATKLQAEFQKVGDYDGVNGLQCVDIVRWYIDTYTTLKSTSGNGKDLVERLASNYGLSIDSVPKAPGIFSVAGSHKTWGCSGSAYGHTGIVVSVDTTKVTVKPPCAWTGMRQ